MILFINDSSGYSEVGLYTAGWGLTNQYVGLIFSSMGADYYPRLTQIQEDKEQLSLAVNQQSEIALLIIAPMMILYVTFMPIVVRLLFTDEFLPIINFSRWIILGMIFKTVAWALGYVVLAKGDTKRFFYNEMLFNPFQLLLFVIGYHFWGLDGIGIAFGIVNFFYTVFLLVLCKKKYHVSYNKEFYYILIIELIISSACF